MPETSGIQVGDAVIEFLASTTQLDQGIDSLNARIENGMARSTAAVQEFGTELDHSGTLATEAGEQIEGSMDRSRASIGEARGEAALLGEAFGVHLPRHVRSFVAELPGVGEALSAAFAATAILFIIEAVVKLTEKTTSFISTAFIYTQAMKDSEKATADMNSEILRHQAAMEGLKKDYEELGENWHTKTFKSLEEINKSISDQVTALDALKNKSVEVEAAEGGMWNSVKNYALGAADSLLGTHLLETKLTNESTAAVEKAEQEKALAVKKAEDKIAEDREKAASLAKSLAIEERKAKLQQQMQYWQDAHNLTEMLEDDNRKLTEELDKNLQTIKESLIVAKVDPQETPFVKTILAARDAASEFGITLKSDLVIQLDHMKEVFAALATDKNIETSTEDMKRFAKEIDDLQKRIDKFGSGPEVKKADAFFDAWKKGSEESKAAMWGFADAYGQGMSRVIAGEEGLGAAMSAATKQFVGQIGARAMVQGLFYLAQGVADTFWNPARAAADFTAAGEFLALGALATGAAAAIPGGGSSSGVGGSTVASRPVQTTGSTTQTPVTQINAQHFAGGGLISAPTLAMLGDSPSGGSQREAVLPLENPEAMGQIADAIAARMPHGGGAGIQINVKGMVSDDTLADITKKISRKVRNGTANLHASNTFRVTKRSA